MKKALFKIGLIFLICLTQKGIAQETCLIHDDTCIHYSIRQDIKCLDCLINAPLKDSIILLKDSIILKHKNFLEISNSTIKILDEQLINSKNELILMRKKRKNAFFTGAGSSFSAILIIFILVK